MEELINFRLLSDTLSTREFGLIIQHIFEHNTDGSRAGEEMFKTMIFNHFKQTLYKNTKIKNDKVNTMSIGDINKTIKSIIKERPRKKKVSIKSINVDDEEEEKGKKSVQWNAIDYKGQKVATGIYFFKIETELFSESKKMILLK